jgi:hypothetical protein
MVLEQEGHLQQNPAFACLEGLPYNLRLFRSGNLMNVADVGMFECRRSPGFAHQALVGGRILLQFL